MFKHRNILLIATPFTIPNQFHNIRCLLYRHLYSRTVLREIKKKGITNILVDTDPRNIDHFFRVILQLQGLYSVMS